MNYLLVHSLKRALYWTPRTASTATARAILTAHCPERLSFSGWHLPPGVSEPPLQRVVPAATALPDDYEAAVVLRHPIDRFLSGCGHAGITVAEGLAQLRAKGGREYILFAPVADRLPKGLRVFRFPDELPELAEWLGTGPILPENAAAHPEATVEQLAELTDLYAADIALYESAGEPAEPAPEAAPPRSAPASVVVRRLTHSELEALRDSEHPEAFRAYLLATSEGVISETDPDYPQLVALLDSLGIVAAERWADLLAP